jgi:NAD(P)-dependent dehydrogenase (short-subunit alcohol dehydrogenase family)
VSDWRSTAGLEGKVCVVTGAGSGIGRAIAVEMARRGATGVAVCDINPEGGAETVRQVDAAGSRGVFFECDVSEESQVRDTFRGIAAGFDGIHVLVNNAGIVDTQLTDRTRLDEIPTEVWDRVFAVNVRGAWLCIKHAVPLLRDAEAAAIVNCASISGFVAFEGESSYCASKAAVVLLTQSAALDLRRFGIRCNCYCPGTVETPLMQTALAASVDPEAARRDLGAMHLTPEPRLAAPEEIAKVVCFLASEDASFVNGTAVRVDGGALAWRGIL